jgi:hypothetical protein
MTTTIQQTRVMPQVAFRVDAELIERLDRLVQHLEDHPDFAGLDLNRSAIVKMLVRRALDATEEQYGVKKRSKKK